MNKRLLYFEKFLNMLGFKKFMRMHVSAFFLFIFIMLGQLINHIMQKKLDSANISDVLLLLAQLLFVYLCLRVFQAIFERRIDEDRFMYFGAGNRKRT